MTPLVVPVPWPEGLNPNDRLADWRKRQAQAAHREAAFFFARSEIARRVKAGDPVELPPEGAIRVTYTFRPKPRAQRWDDDNAVAAMKWARDAIAEALRVDDKRFALTPVLWGERTAFGSVVVEVGG